MIQLTSLFLLSSYTSIYDRTQSSSTNLEISVNEAAFLEFSLPSTTSTTTTPSSFHTVLDAELTIFSTQYDGTLANDAHLTLQVQLDPVLSNHETASPLTLNTTAIFAMLPTATSWTTEITNTIRPRLQTSSFDATQETIPASYKYAHTILPRGRKEDGKDFLKLGLRWLEATPYPATFLRIANSLHPDRTKWPTLKIRSTTETYSSVEPTVIPENTATDLTVQGAFVPEHWYSCCFGSVKNSTATTLLNGLVFRGPFTQARSTTVLHCESPPVNRTEKQCTTYETIDTFGNCYDTLKLVILRRWRHEREDDDREVPLGFYNDQGNVRSVDIVITTGAKVRSDNNNGAYANSAPHFEGTSGGRMGTTYHGSALEEHDNPPNRGSVL
jgi:hypothetical protein